MSDIEATLARVSGHKGVLGTVIVNHAGTPLRSTLDEVLTKEYATLIPSLADLARNLVRDLDPQVCFEGVEEFQVQNQRDEGKQNDLEFLRIRSIKHEIMVAASPEFVLIVIQDPIAATQ